MHAFTTNGSICCIHTPQAVSFALGAAHSAATKLDVLLHANHALQPVNIAALPDWLLAFLRGQEKFAQVRERLVWSFWSCLFGEWLPQGCCLAVLRGQEKFRAGA